jgi:hypothetical protein
MVSVLSPSVQLLSGTPSRLTLDMLKLYPPLNAPLKLTFSRSTLISLSLAT